MKSKGTSIGMSLEYKIRHTHTDTHERQRQSMDNKTFLRHIINFKWGEYDIQDLA